MLSRVWITSLSGSPRWMLSPNLFNSLLGNMLSKRRLKMAVIIAILTGLFWYVVIPILNQQTVYSHYSRNAPADNIVTIWHNDTPTPSHTRHVTHPPATTKVVSRDYLPDVLNLTISDAFVKSIPRNGAYWNRLFHTILKGMAEGENKIRNQSWPHCRESSHELLLTNVHDFNTYTEVAKDFVRGMDCKSPPILIDQPNKCRSGDGKTFLLFAIKSSPGNFVRRQTLRETWGKEGVYEGGLRVRTVFLLGSSPSLDDPDLGQLLAFEARFFGDVLQWDFHDSLFNLALKQHMFFKWTQKNCPHVSFVFNGDDDVFVNTRQILNHVKSLDPTQASRAYIGQILLNAWPIRDPKSKYYVPVSFYDGPYLPYAGGGGFLFSGALLEPLYNVSYAIPFFPIDDVFIGMCFSAIGVRAVQHNAFRTFDIRVEDRENICIHQDLLLVHQKTPQQTMKLWRGINNPDLRC